MSSVTESNLEKKFQHVTNTQDSIQSFSLWIIHHKSHCKKIVDVWIKILRKTKISHRLTLLYLANDVIQNSKRKGATQYLDTFFNVLPEATVLFRDDQIRGSVERVFNIWESRNIYSGEQIEELKNALHNTEETNNATSKAIAEFKPEALTEKIRKVVKMQLETTSKLSALNGSKLDAANSEVLRQFKDRTHGQQFSKDFEEATRCLEEYIAALEREVAEQAETNTMLEQAVIYYETQRGEARIVANAYKSFSNRISVQKKKLEGLKSLLPSPFPSPCADAPSPSNSEECLDLVPEAAVAAPLVSDAPSPVGTPEDLQLSPRAEENLVPEEQTQQQQVEEEEREPEELKMPSPVVSTSGNIPVVTSFLGTQAAGLMSSWLDALNSTMKKCEPEPKAVSENKAEDSLDSRLDSRLLNLVQNLPSSVPSALLAGVGGDTPVKDEWASAQGTPVQDEDETHESDLLKHLGRYSSTNSPSQTQWPSALPPNTTALKVPSPTLKDDIQDFQNDEMELSNKGDKDDRIFNNDDLDDFRNENTDLFDTKTTNSYEEQDVSSFKKEESVAEVRPLLPPPKPTFACFDMLSRSPPALPVNKIKSDLRISTQNFASPVPSNTSSPIGSATPTSIIAATPSAHSGKDDIEPMDMDIGESDDDEDKSTRTDPKGETKTTVRDEDISNHKLQKVSMLQGGNSDNEDGNLTKIRMEDQAMSESDEKPTSYSTYRHYTFNRMTENNLSENKINENSLSETIQVESRNSDESISSSRANEKNVFDNTITEARINDNGIPENRLDDEIPGIMENELDDSRLVENRIQENRMLDNRLPESRMIESHISQNRMQDIRPISNILTESRGVESRQSENRLVDNRSPEERFSENNKASSAWEMEGTECLRIQTIQTVRNDDWRSPPWDDGPPSYNYRSPPQQHHHHHHHYRPHMQPYDDRRPYERRQFNELGGYGRGYPPPMPGPKRFQAPYGGRGGRGYYVPRY